MTRIAILAAIVAATIGCGRAAQSAGNSNAQFAAANDTASAVVPAASPAANSLGPRWIVVKADGLNCTACADTLKSQLEEVRGVSHVETFAPSPYCRFYVEDGSLDVPALINAMPDATTTLAGWKFIRGGTGP